MNINSIKEYLSIPSLLIKIGILNSCRNRKIDEISIRYGKDKKQKVILMLPHKISKKTTLVYIHGGGWKNGSASAFRFAGQYMATLGFKVILTGYRLVPKARYPAQINDVVLALETAAEELHKREQDISGLIFIGQSAGGQLAGLMALKDQSMKRIKHGDVKGLICISGVMNFDLCKGKIIRHMIRNYVHPGDLFDDANPINHISKEKTLRILCIHGAKDPLVPVESSESFVKEFNTLNPGRAELMIIRNGLHSNLIKLLFGTGAEFSDILKWINNMETGHSD